VTLNRESRQEQAAGFVEAGNQMIEHFDAALTRFESEVRDGTANVRVVAQNGQGGGGAFGLTELLILLAMNLRWLQQRIHNRRTKSAIQNAS
jgi:rhombotail lipoprotein